MKNDILFESMRRIYNSHANAGAMDFSTIAMMVQTSGRNDPTYSLGVACAFKSLAGANWDAYCRIYDTSRKITEHEMEICRSPLQKFWRSKAMKQRREEFEHIAWRLIKMTESD